MSKTSQEKITPELWRKYRETKSLALRNKILMEYLHIITINAKRMGGAYQNRGEMEDIINQGVIALAESIDRYDYTKGVQFDSFASIRVRGSIIDYLRKQDWVPRDIRKKAVDFHNAYAALQGRLERCPTDEEMAAYLGIPLVELRDIAAQSQNFSLLSYESLLQEKLAPMLEPKTEEDMPEQSLYKEELKQMIASSIDQLGERERLIISLYYYEGLKLKEIAVILGLTPSRISQLHAKALAKMEKSLAPYMHE